MKPNSPFIRQFRIWTLILLLLLVVISYATLYRPYHKALESMTLEKFVVSSQSYMATVDQYILRHQDSAQNLSHELFSHGYLSSYLDGRLSQEALLALSEEDFLNKAAEQPHLIAGVRLLLGRVNATLGHEYLPALLSQQKDSASASLQTDFLVGRETPSLFVAVPFVMNGQIYGYDLLLYDLKSLTNVLDGKQMTFSFIRADQVESIWGAGAKQLTINSTTLYDNGWLTGYCMPVRGIRQFVHVSISNDLLYEKVNNIERLNLVGYAALVGVVLFLSNQFILFHVRHLVGHAERSKERYRDIAHRDPLTGVSTRGFLEEWKALQAPYCLLEMRSYPLVMIDVNDLKVINDTQGHKAGDQALKYVADTLKRMLRSEDLIIRYGGDEFLVILTGCSTEDAEAIFQRIHETLIKAQPFSFPVTISYGIASLWDMDHFDEAVHVADEKMYDFKINNRLAFA